MKRLPGILAALLLIMSAFGACKLIVGPDTPGGNGGGGGTLTISFGDGGSGGSRAVTSGAELPGEVLAGMRYELNLTGPNHETIGRTVSAGETLRETVKAGQWRIDAAGYYHDVLAGTGSVTVAVVPGDNAVRIPMMMSGPCYEVTVDPRIVHGTVRANFGMAFEGTPVTLTVTPDSDSALKTGGLTYNGSVITGGPPYTFTLSGLDVTVGAEFIQFARYVRAGGSGDGTSWDNASGDLQEMMDELEAIPSSDYTGPRIVKVAAGTYKPAWEPMVPSVPGGPYAYTPGGQDSAFILRQGVQVWGGYPASGGDDGSRNPSTHVTTLSGDIDGDNTLNGNTYHVVVGVNLPAGSGAVLGGLTITGGNAGGSGSGSGVTVDGTALNRQYGGGMYNDNSSPILISVTISGNFAYDGAGMNNNNSSPALVNVLISGNKADSGGGGIKAVNSTPILTNVTISGNRAGYRGAGIYNDGSSLQINNSIIWGNGGGGYPGIFTDFGSPAPAITYSIVEESGGGTSGNVAAPGSSPFIDWKDPSAGGWAATTEGNYRLDGSAGVNAGNDTLYPENADDISVFPSGLSDAAKAAVNGALAKDLAGANRRNGTIDMGAYEKN